MMQGPGCEGLSSKRTVREGSLSSDTEDKNRTQEEHLTRGTNDFRAFRGSQYCGSLVIKGRRVSHDAGEVGRRPGEAGPSTAWS